MSGIEDRLAQLRLVEAVLFASAEPVTIHDLRRRLPPEADLPDLLAELQAHYQARGVVLERHGDAFAFRTADDLAHLLQPERRKKKPLSRAATETLAVIAYHQPVTRAEIEDIRGVALAKGTLDTLLEHGWVQPGGRRETPGRPLTWVTTRAFLDHFGLESLRDLPGIEEMRASGLLDRSSLPLFDRDEDEAASEDGGETNGDEGADPGESDAALSE